MILVVLSSSILVLSSPPFIRLFPPFPFMQSGPLNPARGYEEHYVNLAWPYDIRACDSVNVIKRKLKTHLFNIAYPT